MKVPIGTNEYQHPGKKLVPGVEKVQISTNKCKCIFYWEVLQISNRTNRIDELLEHRLLVLKSKVNTIRKRLNKYPTGNLKIKKVKGNTYYCVVDENSTKQRYINVSNINEAQNIAQRDYDLNYLKHAENEIKDIERILANNIFLALYLTTVFDRVTLELYSC